MTITIPSFHLSSIGPWIDPDGDRHPHPAAGCPLPQGTARPASPQLALAGPGRGGRCRPSACGAAPAPILPAWSTWTTSPCFFYLIFILGAALTVLISRQYLEEYGKNLGEYYALLLFATVGMMLMAASAHLIMIFLGLEIMSIAVYVLAGLFREDARSNEAALKYLILGSFSSGFLLFGMAMLYGASGGTLYLNELPQRLAADPPLPGP